MAVSFRDIYFYAVCFVMLLLVVIGLFQIVSAALAFFDPTGESFYAFFPSETSIERRLASEHPDATEEELDAMVQEELERNRARQNFRRWERLVKALAYIAIPLPIYRYHWRKVRDNS